MTRGDGVRVMISLLPVLRLTLAGALLTGAAGAGLADQSGGRGTEPEARQGRPERSNGAPRAAVEVAASVVEKWPGSPIHYVEVTVTGPFFQADGTGPLTIRAVSDPERGPWTPIDPSDDPWALVNEYFSGSLNFYRNDSLLLRYDEGDESNSIAGVCPVVRVGASRSAGGSLDGRDLDPARIGERVLRPTHQHDRREGFSDRGRREAPGDLSGTMRRGRGGVGETIRTLYVRPV